jgi:hypothetical protein
MRKLITGIAAGVAVVGLGAAAFAVDGEPGTTEPGTDPAVTTTAAPTTTAPTTPSEPADEVVVDPSAPTEDEPGPERSTEGCDGETYRNHGEYVSSVARDPDREPGDVPAAAQSECGKPLHETTPPETEPPDAGEPEVPETETETEHAVPGPPPGVGNGNANGHAKGPGPRS